MRWEIRGAKNFILFEQESIANKIDRKALQKKSKTKTRRKEVFSKQKNVTKMY